MVGQHPKPSYRDIMRELEIEIISPICHSNLINSKKNADNHKNKGFKIKHLKGLRFRENDCLFLSYKDNEFTIAIFSQKREKEGFSKEINFTTK